MILVLMKLARRALSSLGCTARRRRCGARRIRDEFGGDVAAYRDDLLARTDRLLDRHEPPLPPDWREREKRALADMQELVDAGEARWVEEDV